ncbi:MAG TPA: adenylate/guanylate cyclase domain-containing protein [Candidatus Ozemobacteraceae bacterium]|nr:adenylate/guanylate cyclase domain-containing protein [Candidatus Ozemobacteraceae bacterium]
MSETSTIRPPLSLKLLVFLAGALVLLLPAWLIRASLTETETYTLEMRRQNAARLLDTAIHLTRHQDLTRLLIAEQFEEESLRFAERLAASGSSPSTELEALSMRLRSSNLTPTLILSQTGTPARSDILGPHSPEELVFLRDFLGLLTQSLVGSVSATESRRISDAIPHYLGSVQTVTYYNHEIRGTAAPILFRGQPSLLFWMPLLDPVRLPVVLRPPTRDALFRPNLGRLQPETWKQLIFGGIVFIIPQPEPGGHTIHSTIRRYAARGISLAFIPEGSGQIRADRAWTKKPLRDCLRGKPAPEGWLVSRGTAFFGKPYTVLGAQKFPESPPGSGFRTLTLRIIVWSASILGLLIWYSTLFCQGGLVTSLGRQLTAGFFLAALFPLTATFLVIEPYAAERHEMRVQEVRSDLRRTMQLLELQSLSHRPRIWHLIDRLFSTPEFLAAARRDAAGLPGARVDLESELRRKFMRLYQKPVDISLRKLILAGMGSYVRDQVRPEDLGGESSMLPQLMNQVANQAIAARGGAPAAPSGSQLIVDGERGSAAETRQEIVWDVGREIFQSILGPESFFDWLNGKSEPVLIEAGIGMIMIYELFLPAPSHPEFLLTALLRAKPNENNAMARTLSGPWRDGPVFAFQRDLIGEPCYPETGERFPFLRNVARQVDASASPLSLRMEAGGTSWLVEGTPGEASRQFVFTALADEAPIRAETEALRHDLNVMLLLTGLIILLLAASVTRDITAPLRSLIEGIRAIGAGRYAHRVESDRTDELGELAGAFNMMTRGLEERDILSRMVSGSALTAATTQDGELLAREGSRRDSIVCFVSFPGIESRMAEMPPEEALLFLNRHVVVAGRILHAAGADIDKLLGPKLLAVFPTNRGSTAVAAARQLHHAFREGRLAIAPAVGLTIGPVIAGILGSGDRRDHTIIGDTVNLAARAASLAEKFDPAGIVLDDALRQHVRDIGSFEQLGETQVKGKSRPVRLVRLLVSRHVPGRRRR